MSKDTPIQEGLKEIFKRVGLTYDPTFCEDKQWYLKKSWTVEEQADFVKWYTKKLTKDLRIVPSMANKQALWFVMNYGWTTKQPTEE